MAEEQKQEDLAIEDLVISDETQSQTNNDDKLEQENLPTDNKKLINFSLFLHH